MEFFLSFELSPEPMSLFKRGQMRPADSKYKLADSFRKDLEYADHVDGSPLYIADGGYLLHKIVWPSDATYWQILNNHVEYIIRHYGRNVIVIMDGYGNENCTKISTRRVRASRYTSREITFDCNMKAVIKQSEFLGS